MATIEGLYPSWNADGSALYYTNSVESRGRYVRRLDLNSQTVELVSSLPETVIAVIGSPVGPEVAALKPGQPGSVLWLCSEEGHECQHLHSAASIVQFSIEWAPDGRQLYLLRRTASQQFPAAELVAIERSDPEPRILDSGNLTFPIEAPGDGSLYYARFADLETDQRELLRMDLGTGVREVLPLPSEAGTLRGFTVSPDGRYVLMRDTNGALWLGDVAREDWRKVADQGWGAFWLLTAPEEFRFFYASEGSDELLVRGGSTWSTEVVDVTVLSPDAGWVVGHDS